MPSLKTPKKLVKPKKAFISFPKKELTQEQRKRVFAQLKKRKQRQLHPNAETRLTRTYFASSPSTLATMRVFYSAKEARNYIRKVKDFEERVKKAKPKSFDLYPSQFFGIENEKILERVYRSPSIESLISNINKKSPNPEFKSRFLRQLKKRLLKKGFDLKNSKNLKEFELALKRAHQELFEIKNSILKENLNKRNSTIAKNFSKGKVKKIPPTLVYDINIGNILVHDYNPRTGKVLISVIDLGGSNFT